MWSNLELSSTLFELGWASIPGGLAAGGRDLVSRLLGGNPNSRPPTESIGPFDWAGCQVKIQSSVATLQKRPPGQGSEVSIRTVFPRVTSVMKRPGGKVGTAH